VLLYFEGELDWPALDFELAGQGVVDAGQRVGKLNIDYRTVNFNDFSCIHISIPAWELAGSSSIGLPAGDLE
jgi:hypothetical protein